MQIKFGDQTPVIVEEKRAAAAAAREGVKNTGLETNSHTQYDTNVKFENIPVNVNVARVKTDGHLDIGVAKGALMDGVPITVPTNSEGATMHAMKKRCDYTPTLKTIADFDAGHKLVMAKIPILEEIRVDADLMERYFAECKPSKAHRLREAILNDTWSFEGGTKHVFSKQEVLLKEHRAQPRVVYQGTDMYNLLVGSVVMELNRRMGIVHSELNPLNTGNKIIYACGVPGETLGEIIEQARGEPIESDAKNNDGSQSAQFRRPEAMYYKKLGAPAWFVREFAKNVEVKVWTRYGVAAQVKGERWSGEGTTTTGNSYIHQCLIQRAHEVAGVKNSVNIHGGDDYLGIVESPPENFKSCIENVYENSGMVAEVVPQVNKTHATFYRKRYARCGSSRRPLPQFGRTLSKLNLRANKNSEVNDRDYMAGKYLSAAYEHRFIPTICDILVDTSKTLSATPHIDFKDTKIKGTAEEISRKIDKAEVMTGEEIDNFLEEVYHINHQDLIDLYTQVAHSCIDYCDGWTTVDRRTGKVKNKKNSASYTPQYISGSIVDALTQMDI
jgi:hypothetical protein